MEVEIRISKFGSPSNSTLRILARPQTENGFMEPKYLPEEVIYTPIIIWEGDWILRGKQMTQLPG